MSEKLSIEQLKKAKSLLKETELKTKKLEEVSNSENVPEQGEDMKMHVEGEATTMLTPASLTKEKALGIEIDNETDFLDHDEEIEDAEPTFEFIGLHHTCHNVPENQASSSNEKTQTVKATVNSNSVYRCTDEFWAFNVGNLTWEKIMPVCTLSFFFSFSLIKYFHFFPFFFEPISDISNFVARNSSFSPLWPLDDSIDFREVSPRVRFWRHF